MTMMMRKSKGRQKVQMTRMSKESNLLVTFSKRRSGLFKKASELSTLCGVEIAIVVFSPGKKVFSFGHPCVEAIVDRFLNANKNPSTGSSSSTLQLVEAHRNASVRELNVKLSEVLNELEVEKKRGEDLGKMRKASQDKHWWEGPIEKLGLEELEQLKCAMEELKKNIGKRAENLMAEAAINPSSPAANFHHGLMMSKGGGAGGGSVVDSTKVASSGFGLFMTPHGYTLGFTRGFY